MTAPDSSPHSLAIFVESIRWLNVRWGMWGAKKGLRLAGFEGEFLYWRWHQDWRGWLVLPALMNSTLLEREAQRLAEFIVDRRRTHPQAPIHLIGYSCGGYIALRALELLPTGVQVDSAVFLSAAFDPEHNLSAALEHVRGRLINYSSAADFAILGLGTMLFGTGDRTHSPSAGMVGLKHPSANNPRVVQVRWRLGMALLGNDGSHFHTAAPRFFARHIAPLMGLESAFTE